MRILKIAVLCILSAELCAGAVTHETITGQQASKKAVVILFVTR
jgi:hypothetical protein